MERIYLSRRNLLTLLSKLDRKKFDDQIVCSIGKHDTLHAEYPCSAKAIITAVEDADYYADRA